MSYDEERVTRQIDADTEREDRRAQTARWNDVPRDTVPLSVVRTPRLGAVARCPDCGSAALVRESLTLVSCRHCGEWSRT